MVVIVGVVVVVVVVVHSSSSSMLYQYDTIQHSSTHCTESPNLGHVHLYSSEHNCAYCCVKQMIIAVQCSELWNSPGQFLDSTDSSMRRSNLFLSNFIFYILFFSCLSQLNSDEKT